MSIRIMSAVFDSTSLGPTERLIMLALADHADDDGRCYPSVARLCRRTGLSERAVQTNIRKLSDQGYIRVIPGGGKGRSNIYFITANPAQDAPIVEPYPAAGAPFDGSYPAAGAPLEKLNPAAGAPQTPHLLRSNPAAGAPEPSGTIMDPSEYPPLTPPNDPKPKKPTKQKRGTRLPEDWQLPRGWGEWAVGEGWHPSAIQVEADRFRDYWISRTGRGSTKLDWQATWRNWMRNSNAARAATGGRHDQEIFAPGESIPGGFCGGTGERRRSSPHRDLVEAFARSASRDGE